VPPSHTVVARKALGPDKLLIPEQAVVLNIDPDGSDRLVDAIVAWGTRPPLPRESLPPAVLGL
jgi:hypothetical protein